MVLIEPKEVEIKSINQKHTASPHLFMSEKVCTPETSPAHNWSEHEVFILAKCRE